MSASGTSYSRRRVLRTGLLGILGLAHVELLVACAGSGATRGAEGIPAKQTLTAFLPDASAGSATGLPARVAWASTANSEFFLALSDGMKAAASARGCDYVTATSGNDPRKHASQMKQFLARGVGALAMQPLDAAADAPVLQAAIDKGVCVQGIITAPSTLQIAASQYQIGYDQGVAAADYATAELAGQAEVIYFNLDTVAPALAVRHEGVLAGLATGGSGIRVVSDLTVTDISTQAGFATMSTALQAHPDIKIVLGGDTAVVGAYKALKQSGKLKDDMFLAGVDGESEALDLIEADGPYRLSIAFAWKLMGYGMGQFGADWIAGKSIPRVMVAKGVRLDSPAAVSAFRAASSDPATVFADRSQYEAFLPLLGNVSFATRENVWTTTVTPP